MAGPSPAAGISLPSGAFRCGLPHRQIWLDQDLEEIKRAIDWQLKSLRTDYIDFGFIHCVDELADLETAVTGGALEYIQALKAQGAVRHIGLSSHTPLWWRRPWTWG